VWCRVSQKFGAVLSQVAEPGGYEYTAEGILPKLALGANAKAATGQVAALSETVRTIIHAQRSQRRQLAAAERQLYIISEVAGGADVELV
jgi:hypothetical protein